MRSVTVRLMRPASARSANSWSVADADPLAASTAPSAGIGPASLRTPTTCSDVVAPIAPMAPVDRTINSVSAPSGVPPPQAGVYRTTSPGRAGTLTLPTATVRSVAGGDRARPVERAGLEASVPGDDELGAAGYRGAEQAATGDDAAHCVTGGGIAEVGVDPGEAADPPAHVARQLAAATLVGDGVMAADGDDPGGAGRHPGDLDGLRRIGQRQGLVANSGGQRSAALRLVAVRDGSLRAERRRRDERHEGSQQDPTRGAHEHGDS